MSLSVPAGRRRGAVHASEFLRAGVSRHAVIIFPAIGGGSCKYFRSHNRPALSLLPHLPHVWMAFMETKPERHSSFIMEFFKPCCETLVCMGCEPGSNQQMCVITRHLQSTSGCTTEICLQIRPRCTIAPQITTKCARQSRPMLVHDVRVGFPIVLFQNFLSRLPTGCNVCVRRARCDGEACVVAGTDAGLTATGVPIASFSSPLLVLSPFSAVAVGPMTRVMMTRVRIRILASFTNHLLSSPSAVRASPCTAICTYTNLITMTIGLAITVIGRHHCELTTSHPARCYDVGVSCRPPPP